MSPSRARTVPSLHDLAVIALVASAPLIVFLPALWNGWVWDDSFNFEMNDGYRGLGWSHLQWMFTNKIDGHWIPLTWLTLALDYRLWGMNPVGYHLVNLLLHAGTAWAFFLVAARLLRLARPSADERALMIGAAVASLYFSVHPLRTESVAWVTERRDVLSGLFVVVAVLAYLRAHDPEYQQGRRWMPISIAAFQLAVLSKSIAVTLPFILLVLDVYPLGRLEAWPTRWLRASNRRVLLEKLPFLPMAVVAAFLTAYTYSSLNLFTRLTLLERLAAMTYSLWFYVWKTAVPAGLTPLYELPVRIDVAEPKFVVAAAAVLAITAVVLALARRWPAGLAAWVAYGLMIGPVSGVKHNGVQLVADRYSYLACMPWALLIGAGVCAIVEARRRGRVGQTPWRLLATSAVAGLLALALMAAQQTTVWRTQETLWRHATASDPRCFLCQHNLGITLLKDGRTAEAIDRLELATTLRQPASMTHAALVMAHVAQGAWSNADDHLQSVRHSDPELARDLAALFITTW